MTSYTTWQLPDPETQSEFYADVNTKRLLAFGIDTVAIALLSILVLPFTAFIGIFIFPFIMGSVGFVYRVLGLSKHSATWGMRIMAVEFRDEAGRLLDMQQAILHTAGLYVSFAFMPVQIISVGFMLMSKRGQGLTDRMLNTVLINRRARS